MYVDLSDSYDVLELAQYDLITLRIGPWINLHFLFRNLYKVYKNQYPNWKSIRFTHAEHLGSYELKFLLGYPYCFRSTKISFLYCNFGLGIEWDKFKAMQFGFWDCAAWDAKSAQYVSLYQTYPELTRE